MQLPIVNINGTQREDLLTDYMQAKAALKTAAGALSSVWPHGRDYPASSLEAHQAALSAAQREHADRLLRVRAVLAEIETIAEHLI